MNETCKDPEYRHLQEAAPELPFLPPPPILRIKNYEKHVSGYRYTLMSRLSTLRSQTSWVPILTTLDLEQITECLSASVFSSGKWGWYLPQQVSECKELFCVKGLKEYLAQGKGQLSFCWISEKKGCDAWLDGCVKNTDREFCSLEHRVIGPWDQTAREREGRQFTSSNCVALPAHGDRQSLRGLGGSGRMIMHTLTPSPPRQGWWLLGTLKVRVS